MEGVVDHHMRFILAGMGGIDFCVTEFIRVTDHTLPRRVFVKYCPELLKGQEGCLSEVTSCPVRLQLLGSNAIALANNARKAAKLGAVGIDLNFGCPAKTVNKNRGGACLLNETDLIYEIVSRVREAVPHDVPVTAKIRLGFENRSTYMTNALAIEKAGADELFVHARSKADGYNPPAYWGYIGEINNAVNIPVVANGEIWSVDDFIQCQQQSKSLDFMIGRGLLAKPDLARTIKTLRSDGVCSSDGWNEIGKKVHEFFLMSCQFYPKKHMGNRVKQWLFYLKRTYPEANNLFEKIKRERDFDTIDSAILRSISS